MGERLTHYSGFFPSPVAHGPSSIPLGFTLLELMISLTIMGLVLVLVFGAFRIGSRAWEKGERDVEVHQRERIVLDLLKRQIASACPREIKLEDQAPFLMRGDTQTLEFITCIPAIGEVKSGMVYAKYEVREVEGGMELLLYEKPVSRLVTDKDPGRWEPEESYPLIPDAKEIGFLYLKPSKDDTEAKWQERWDPEEDQGFPMAVRVAYQANGRKDPLVVLARVTSEAP